MNALHQSIELAKNDGFRSWMEAVRMAAGARTGQDRAIRGNVESAGVRNYWPGRTHGIRAPGLFETALSWAEVRVALAVQA